MTNRQYRKYLKKRKRGYQFAKMDTSSTKYWISSNNNNFIQKDHNKSVYFLVEYIDNGEDRIQTMFGSNKYKTTVLTERQFKKVKGFVPIKPKKFRMSMSNGRLGMGFGSISMNRDKIEQAIINNKIELREERLKKLLDK